MQPPTKIKEIQQVKQLFSDQLTKLQSKLQQDTELLEEIRLFTKQRAAIERDYAQALQRLAVQYQKKDWQRANSDSISSSVFGVWRAIVDATAQMASTRLSASEEYRSLTLHTSRSLRSSKDNHAKKGMEQLQKIQAELLDSLRELQRIKKSYHQLSLIAHTAREKAADAHARARKSEHGLFHFKSHKMITKVNTRLKECDDRLTEVRNEYLLTLAALQAHQQHYYSHDLPAVMEQMDGSVYEELRGHFSRLCGTELDTCASTHSQHSHIWDTLRKVTRERSVQQFLQESSAFSNPPNFSFQPAPKDQVYVLQDLSGSPDQSCLQREVKKWASKAAKDYKVIAHGERALEVLQSRLKLLSGETSASVEQKITEVQDTLRKTQLSRVKAEARLQLLSHSVPGTQDRVQQALHTAHLELEQERRLSESRKSTGNEQEEDFELTDLEEFEEEADIFVDSAASTALCVCPSSCRVLYSYQACQSDELSVMEGEELQVLEDGDMEDWLKVCNSCGQVGYVPVRYVQFLCLPAEGTPPPDTSYSSTSSTGLRESGASPGLARALYSYQAQSPEELSFQEGALIHLIRCKHGEVDDGFWEGALEGHVGLFPSLVVELLEDEAEEEGEEQEPLPTPTMPSCSPPALHPQSPEPSADAACTPPGGAENIQHTPDPPEQPDPHANPDRGSSPPSVSTPRLRPCRAPPPPPTQRT
ncbi:F-BAR and double SH3 domains protein 1-like isoform X2 [Boleophthalmus pectinirostris]|uniref:F-BAR and double SH3 domains protein 1-like isoform X2 n=1 Tax=Boleophthalmus pectinirostris TaxID=150288 RepID=UPI00242E2AE2|nr:F-BAR and double SH3 domains protein 1-like isoform X2 [Boleophthalmus pectinirostris]